MEFMNGNKLSRARAHALGRGVLTLALGVGLTACDTLGTTGIENPNVVAQEDVENPTAAPALVSGLLFRTSAAMAELAVTHATISDELTWRGSFDNVGALDRGSLVSNTGWYGSPAYTALTTARWLGDQTIEILEAHQAAGVLPNLLLLARTYWLTGMVYVEAAANFEEFAISDRRTAGPVVPRGALYDRGIELLGQASTTAQQAGDANLETTAMAYRARAYWMRAYWDKMRPGTRPSEPLISDTQANALATQVLARVPANWRHVFTYSPTTQESRIGFEVNSRSEVVVENHIIEQDASRRFSCRPGHAACNRNGIRLRDPIDNIQDPALATQAFPFLSGFVYSDLVGISAQELNLILAEAALLAGNMGNFRDHINAVRALEPSLTPYNPLVHALVDSRELLVHMRQVNLFLQNQRRLPDLYRFGIRAPEWVTGETALTSPGKVHPIGHLECNSNPLVTSC